MKILIISNFSTRIESDRFAYIGEMLCERGHQVTLLTSDFNHDKKEHVTDIENSLTYKTSIVLLHEPGYPSNISFKRLWSHYQWGINVEEYLKNHERPDVIYCAIPSLTASVRAADFCKKNGIRFVIDVQDLWPEAFQMAVKNKLLQQAFKPISWYINHAYSSADVIVAVSETYAKRASKVNHKGAKAISVFLGNDGALFEEARNSEVVDKPIGILQLCYIGTLGYSYDLKCVIDAIDIYNRHKELPPIQFLVMGHGPLKEEFENYAKEKAVDAVFTGTLPYHEMVERLCKCDIVVNPIVAGSAASIINKVGDYALSGLPVINTQESVEYRRLVKDYNCGFNCKVGDALDFENTLEILVTNEELRKTMGKNARHLGNERFDRRQTYKEIVKVIEK